MDPPAKGQDGDAVSEELTRALREGTFIPARGLSNAVIHAVLFLGERLQAHRREWLVYEPRGGRAFWTPSPFEGMKGPYPAEYGTLSVFCIDLRRSIPRRPLVHEG